MSVTNCTFNKPVDKYGVRNLQKKQKILEINISNKNDATVLLGPPSTKSAFDENLWIYIQSEKIEKNLFQVRKSNLLTNNILILEFDARGLLVKKEFLDINDMKDIEISKLDTKNKFSNKSFVYNFLSSLRQKINDPLGKRKKPSQQ